MKQYLLTLLFLTCLAQVQAQNETFSADQLKRDLAVYKQALVEVHPDAFLWYPRDSFDYWIAQVEQQLTGPMSLKHFQSLLLPIHQKVGCGHSRIARTKDDVKAENKRYKAGAARHFLPLRGQYVQQKFYVTKDYTEDEALPKGTEITAIDGLPILQVLDTLALYVTSDGYNTTHYRRAVNRSFTGLYRRHFGNPDDFLIAYKDSLGMSQEKRFPARKITKAGLKEKAKELKRNPPPPDTTLVKTKKTVFKKKKYSFSQSLQDSTVYILRIPKFYGGHGLRFHKKVMKYLNALSHQATLVIDIRGNGGGDFVETATLASMFCPDDVNFELTQPTHLKKEMYKRLTNSRFSRSRHRFFLGLFSEEKNKTDISEIKLKFEPHKKHRFEGPLYVLIDGYSFSASSVLSSFLKDQKRAIFVGEETGGGFHGTNAMSMPYFELPNSELRVRMPMWKLRQVVNGPNQGRGVFPEVTTQWSIDDILDKKDVDMETLLEWKKKMYKEFKKG